MAEGSVQLALTDQHGKEEQIDKKRRRESGEEVEKKKEENMNVVQPFLTACPRSKDCRES